MFLIISFHFAYLLKSLQKCAADPRRRLSECRKMCGDPSPRIFHLSEGFWRTVFRLVSPAGNRLRTHFELHGTAPKDVFVGDVVLGIRLAVEGDAPDVDVLCRGFGCHEAERLAVLQGQHGFLERGACQHVTGRAGAHGVEAEGGEDVPCRHLPGIVVARKAAGRVEVFGL